MKNEKKIEMPDDLEICDGCGHEYPVKELKTCCGKRLCNLCFELYPYPDEDALEDINHDEK